MAENESKIQGKRSFYTGLTDGLFSSRRYPLQTPSASSSPVEADEDSDTSLKDSPSPTKKKRTKLTLSGSESDSSDDSHDSIHKDIPRGPVRKANDFDIALLDDDQSSSSGSPVITEAPSPDVAVIGSESGSPEILERVPSFPSASSSSDIISVRVLCDGSISTHYLAETEAVATILSKISKSPFKGGLTRSNGDCLAPHQLLSELDIGKTEILEYVEHLKPSPAETMTLKIQTRDRKKSFELAVGENELFGQIIIKAAEHLQVNSKHLRFQFDGSFIDRFASPISLDMEDGDCIDVHIHVTDSS